MMLEKGGQSFWTKTLQDFLNLGTIEISADFIVLGVHGAKAQAHPARTY
jgi:hypothetical protein